MIVKDRSSGLLKHQHVGQVRRPDPAITRTDRLSAASQVVIRMDCFLLNTEATFCLPLEDTSRSGRPFSFRPSVCPGSYELCCEQGQGVVRRSAPHHDAPRRTGTGTDGHSNSDCWPASQP